ncbi:hypothetical protein GCM10027610_106110 [Dactylosporangium cerinum]
MYTMDTDSDELTLRAGGSVSGRTISPASILDPTGRKVVLVLTDGVGPAWRGSALRALWRWACAGPTSVVNVLPPRRWNGTTLRPQRCLLNTPGPAAPNRLMDAEMLEAPAIERPAAVPVPVVALDVRWLGWWARFVAGLVVGPAPAMVVMASEEGTPPWPVADPIEDLVDPPPSPLERVLHFRSTATGTAFQLAGYLAAAPLNVPMMELVQGAMLPGSGPSDLSEVLTSGMLHTVNSGHEFRPDRPAFDFEPGVREELLATALRADTARVLRLVSDALGSRVPALQNLRAALEAPDAAHYPQLTAESEPYVRLQHVTLRALSGPYLARAGRLGHIAGVTGLSSWEARQDSFEKPSRNHMDGETMPETAGTASQMTPTLESTQTEPRGSELDPVASRRSPVSFAEAAQIALASVRSLPEEVDPALERPSVFGNVPQRNASFTGRGRLLDDLHARLAVGTTAVLPQAIYGMGGVGKSQLAAEYVYRHANDYQVVWWISAEQPELIRQALVALALQLKLPVRGEANIAVPAVLEALRVGRPFRNWLLVFDNAENVEAARPFFPVDGPGRILVTSRNFQWAASTRTLEVDVFERAESVELLRRRGSEITDTEADMLADALGDLPLAIDQAAVWRAETGMPVAEYLRLLAEKTNEILESSPPPDYQVPVAAAWNISLDALRTRNLGALELLNVCSFFAPEPISRNLLAAVRNAPLPMDLDATLRDAIRLSRAVRDINRYALARIDHRNNTIQLHRLVQTVLMGRMGARQLSEMRHAAHVLLAGGDPNDPVKSDNWARYNELLPHLRVSGAVHCDDSFVRQLIINEIVFLYQWGIIRAPTNWLRKLSAYGGRSSAMRIPRRSPRRSSSATRCASSADTPRPGASTSTPSRC